MKKQMKLIFRCVAAALFALHVLQPLQPTLPPTLPPQTRRDHRQTHQHNDRAVCDPYLSRASVLKSAQ